MERKQIKLTSQEIEEVNKCLLYFDQKKEEISGTRHKKTKMDKNKKSSEGDKSREEIKAEREKKKQQKLAAKQKKKEDKAAEKNKDDKGDKKKDDKKKVDGESKENLTGEPVKKAPSLPREDENEKGDAKVENVEKTREEIKAERERKKLAKQASKNKSEKNEKPQEPIKQEGQKSKAELRAERREKQEAQRAAKVESKKSNQMPESKPKNQEVVKTPQPITQVNLVVSEKKSVAPGNQRVKLFSHLHFDQPVSPALITNAVHPSILKLGAKYSSRVVSGSNARCVALLNALKDLITDFVTPVEKEFSRALETSLVDSMAYLNQCRPSSVSMINALKNIKSLLTQLQNVSEDDAKKKLCEVIDIFIREQIDVAGDAICIAVQKKIANGDVIMIYACSSLLYRILEESRREGKEFTVIVVDGGPWFEGREMLRRLQNLGIKCSYVLVSALSFIMAQTTKVLLGAHALLANGHVMSRAGTSLVALTAKAYNVPVLVCCETYKFCERVQTDVFVYNELGNPTDFVHTDSRLKSWESNPYLTPLSLLYDITPPDLVTAVVTEIAILPCTSVPVILRIKPSDVIV